MYTASGTIDVSARVAEYAPLVRRMAHHLAAKLPASVQIDDMVQAGMIGLMEAASRYEEGHNCTFETFASQRIRGAMLDELREADWLPRSMRKALRRIVVGHGIASFFYNVAVLALMVNLGSEFIKG